VTTLGFRHNELALWDLDKKTRRDGGKIKEIRRLTTRRDGEK
jgi:hypothetical protein